MKLTNSSKLDGRKGHGPPDDSNQQTVMAKANLHPVFTQNQVPQISIQILRSLNVAYVVRVCILPPQWFTLQQLNYSHTY